MAGRGGEFQVREETLPGGLTCTRFAIGTGDDGNEKLLSLFAGRDLIEITDHGHVGGMGSGLWSTHVNQSAPDLGGTVVVSSVCYSGVVTRYFDRDKDGKRAEEPVDPENSFALAILHRGPAAYIAGLDEMHGLYSGRVAHAILLEGSALGDAVRRLQDRMVLEMIDRKYDPAKLIDPDLVDKDEKIGTAANLALYGDPAFRLYPATIERLKTTGAAAHLSVAIDVSEFERAEWVRSKYRSEGDRWGTECAFRVEWTEADDPVSVRVTKSNVAGFEGLSGFFALERDLGKRYLHVGFASDVDEEPVTEQVGKEGYRLELDIGLAHERR